MAAGLSMLAALPVGIGLLLVLLTYISLWTGVATSFFVTETIGLGLTMLWVFPLYLAAGVVGGAIVGCLRPLARWRLGATFLGMIVGTVLYWSVGPVVAAFTDLEVLSLEHLFVSMGLGSTVGGSVAFAGWSRDGHHSRG